MRTSTAGGDTVRDAAAGAIGGVAGTLAMSGVMLVGGRLGAMGTQPPRRVVDEAAEHGAPAGGTDDSRDVTASLLHLVIGSAAGVAQLALRRALPVGARGPLSRAVEGCAFGLAMWAVNYVALAPALNILPPPPKDRPGRPILMILAHLVFGAVSAAAGNFADHILVGARQTSTSSARILD